MAQRDLITKDITLENIKSKGYNPTPVLYKELIQEMIRLDVPLLEVGSSSIGKSYSIRQFMEECGIRGEFLFVGTEKSEFIEGIPNLKAVTEGQAKFSYLKPYWFPDKEEIRKRLKIGRDQILDLSNQDPSIGGLWNNVMSNYAYLEQLKQELLKFKRTETETKSAKKVGAKIGKYIYEDALLYLSTLQGYGNFWLILDEIDKVEKQDKDKYAPLLHIVRERELKGWKLSGIRDYPEYDIKFVTSIDKRIERLNAAIEDPNVDVTDTRIVAIANDLQTMEEESPALYRRFVKTIIRKSLYDEKQAQLPSGDPTVAVGYDWAKQYEIKKQEIHGCIVVKEVGTEEITTTSTGRAKRSGVTTTKGSTISEKMAEIEEEKVGKPLEEMNLQWTLGFLPDILFPGVDTRGQGDIFIKNKLIEDFNDQKDPYQTLLFKIIQDNFDVNYWVPLLECIYDKVSIKQVTANKSSGMDAEVETFFADAGLTKAKFNSPNPKDVEKLIDRYNTKLKFSEIKYEEALEIQKSQARGETISDKSLAGVQGGVATTGRDAIVFGNIMLQKSLNGKTPTELTRMLISSVPFLQIKFISSSPYIPFDGARDLMEIHDNGMVYLITTISGKAFKSEAEAKEATSNVFSTIEPYKPFITKYAVAAPDEYIDAIVDGDYKKITNPAESIRKIIANRPVIIDNQLAGLLSVSKEEDKALKKEYFESIANVKMIEKEIFQNVTYEVWPMMLNTLKKDGLTPNLIQEVTDYVKKFPNTMKLLSDSVDTIAGTVQVSGLNEEIDNEKGLFKLKDLISDLSKEYMNKGSELDKVRVLI
jgi:hypothetical protein